jgi:YfiR/HmsC-like
MRAAGLQTMRERGLQYVADGLTSVDEVNRVLAAEELLGNDALAQALRSMGKLGNGRDVEVRTLNEGESLAQCQVLYFSGISDRAAAATLARVSALPVLRVGEQEHFTQLGGIIRLYPEGSRLRFDVDVSHATAVRLKISSRVLNLARLVKDSDAPNY